MSKLEGKTGTSSDVEKDGRMSMNLLVWLVRGRGLSNHRLASPVQPCDPERTLTFCFSRQKESAALPYPACKCACKMNSQVDVQTSMTNQAYSLQASL